MAVGVWDGRVEQVSCGPVGAPPDHTQLMLPEPMDPTPRDTDPLTPHPTLPFSTSSPHVTASSSSSSHGLSAVFLPGARRVVWT
jgi:hypothetical protein